MIDRIKFISGAALLGLSVALIPSASADSVTVTTPYGTSFGTLAGATFNGTSIDNTHVQISATPNVTLGLTVTPRYGNAAVTNDGAGTFHANAGGDTLDGVPSYAVWNFDFYVSGLTPLSDYWVLYADNKPVAGNAVASSFSLPFDYQDSWNLGMGFLGGASFDPTANGQYAFALYAFDANDNEITHTSILVNVGTGAARTPDTASMMMLVGGSVAGLALLRRFKK